MMENISSVETVEFSMRPPEIVQDEVVPLNVFYAGFGKRFVARLIDVLILLLPNLILRFLGLSSLGFIGNMLYFSLMESSSSGATLGKRAMGLRVRDIYGNQLSFGRALGRSFASILSGIILCAGYFVALFTEKHQTLHDLMAGTLVLEVNEI